MVLSDVDGLHSATAKGRAIMTPLSDAVGPSTRGHELPTFYYLQHFREMLDFVETQYTHVMGDDYAGLIARFRNLDQAAQCLYVRLVNRKGRIHAINKLRYPEIGDLAGALRALQAGEWVGLPDRSMFEETLAVLTKSEILDCVRVTVPGLKRSMKKDELIDVVRISCPPDEFLGRIKKNRLIVQRRDAWVRFLLFLYFGESRTCLSQFTLRAGHGAGADAQFQRLLRAEIRRSRRSNGDVLLR
jgi:DNA polymerase-3 subunit epsilon